jgi:hypothetical protein
MLNLPIDVFLRSLAKDKEKDAVGIILSGTGTDGTLGIRAIKEFGGMVMAQDSDSAKFDGMPQSAVSTGIVDYILTPEKMPVELQNYFKHPFIRKAEDIEVEISRTRIICPRLSRLSGTRRARIFTTTSRPPLCGGWKNGLPSTSLSAWMITCIFSRLTPTRSISCTRSF